MATAPARRPAPAPAGRAAPARRPAAAAPAEPIRTSRRGVDAIAAMNAEAERNEAAREANKAMAGSPFRYYVPAGETRELIIVDEMPDFVRKEHNLQDPRTKKWSVFVPCIDEVTNCPVCSSNPERGAYFALYLTVIDLHPYVDKNGDERPFSKKLLVIKPMQQKKFTRYYERHKTLRGMRLAMTRDSKTDAAIGDPEFIDFADEEEMETYWYSYENQDKEVVEVDCSIPFDYEAIMPDMTEKQLRAMVSGRPDPGSREDNASTLRGGQDRWQDEGRPAARRGAPARNAAHEDGDGDDDDGYQEAPPPRRPAPAARGAAPAMRGAAPARRAAPAIDPDDHPDAGSDGDPPFEADEVQDDNPPPRRAAPVQRGAARPAPARRPAPAPEDEVEEAPQRRGGADVSARRAALRGSR